MKKNPNIKIFVAYHKPGIMYSNDIFVPIHVGKKNSKHDLGILGDDTGDNISDKNNGYCELTAQYWVRKNYDLSDVDYVGFCHYRRFMDFLRKPTPYSPLNAFKKGGTLYQDSISFIYSILGIEYQLPFKDFPLEKVTNHIKDYTIKNDFDLILPRRTVVIHKPFYKLAIQNDKAWEIMDNILTDKYPQYHKITKKMENNLLCSFGNIYLMKKDLFLEYVEWQFGLLLEFEKQIKEKGMSDASIANNGWGLNTRVMGFISERFPCIFAEYQKDEGKKIKYSANILYLY